MKNQTVVEHLKLLHWHLTESHKRAFNLRHPLSDKKPSKKELDAIYQDLMRSVWEARELTKEIIKDMGEDDGNQE